MGAHSAASLTSSCDCIRGNVVPRNTYVFQYSWAFTLYMKNGMHVYAHLSRLRCVIGRSLVLDFP